MSSRLSNKRPVDYALVDKTDTEGKLQSNCTNCVHANEQLFPFVNAGLLPDNLKPCSNKWNLCLINNNIVMF